MATCRCINGGPQMEMATARCSLVKEGSWLSRKSRVADWKTIHKLPYNLVVSNLRMGSQKLSKTHQVSVGPVSQIRWRTYSAPVGMDSTSLQSEGRHSRERDGPKDLPEEILSQPLSSDELKSLLADSERTKLIKKLSEANQQNRFLKRQLFVKEDALVNFKNELAVIELEIQALVKLAEEVSKSGIPEGSRKINGRYIQSHLFSRLEAMHEKVKEQMKDVDVARSKEVPVFWCGMAESVQVMGSFDGWSQGEHLSPEYNGSFTKFSTTIMLRPGRYEIKFLVDGEWQLSPEFPTIGEGLTKNNLLVVE